MSGGCHEPACHLSDTARVPKVWRISGSHEGGGGVISSHQLLTMSPRGYLIAEDRQAPGGWNRETQLTSIHLLSGSRLGLAFLPFFCSSSVGREGKSGGVERCSWGGALLFIHALNFIFMNSPGLSAGSLEEGILGSFQLRRAQLQQRRRFARPSIIYPANARLAAAAPGLVYY